MARPPQFVNKLGVRKGSSIYKERGEVVPARVQDGKERFVKCETLPNSTGRTGKMGVGSDAEKGGEKRDRATKGPLKPS